MLTTTNKICVFLRFSRFCMSQRWCTGCSHYKDEREFERHAVCGWCQRNPQPSTPTISTRIDVASFKRFFDHESFRGARLSNFQRCSLVTLWAINLSVDQMTACDPRTITNTIDRSNQTGSLADLHRSGAPRRTTEDEDAKILDVAETTPKITPRMIGAQLGLAVAKRTIRRRLDAVGLGGHVARTVYPFSDAALRSRYDFAVEHERWSDDDWDRVIFGDESYIMLGSNGQIWVQRPVNTAYDPRYTVTADRLFPPKVGVFACFTSQGVGQLRVIEGEMDTRLYTDTMQRTMLPSAMSAFPIGGWKYLHDNATYHTSRDSYTWFHNHGVDCIEIPPHSPDTNPIENLFNYWKRQVELRFPRTVEELRTYSIEEWNTIPPILCSVLVDSMHDRMLSIINADGHMSSY